MEVKKITSNKKSTSNGHSPRSRGHSRGLRFASGTRPGTRQRAYGHATQAQQAQAQQAQAQQTQAQQTQAQQAQQSTSTANTKIQKTINDYKNPNNKNQ
jgi:uncharacterized membrane protein